MSPFKLLTSSTLVTTLTCSIFISLTSIANAKPGLQDQLLPSSQLIGGTEISGNITKGDSRVDNIPCSQIQITLKEFIPNKPVPGNQFNFPTEKNLVQASATGNHLGEGCSYSLKFRYVNRLRPDGASTFTINAQTGSIVGIQAVSNPFPNKIDIQLLPPAVIK